MKPDSLHSKHTMSAMAPSRYMQQALALAQAAFAVDEVPVGALIVHPEQGVIASAHNRVERFHDPTAHAEMLVIREASARRGAKWLHECDLYVTLEPCAMCATAISLARLRRVYFGAYDRKGGAIDHGATLYQRPECFHKPEVYGGINERECGALLQRFFESKRSSGT